MRPVAAIAFLSLVVAAGCGSGPPSPESVIRAWSHALDVGDNQGAAELFARNAEVIQPGRAVVLHSLSDAVAFNQSLPCSGTIVAISTHGKTVTATFLLGDRQTSPCNGPGQRVRAQFEVQEGKIVLWRQLPSAGSPSAQPI